MGTSPLLATLPVGAANEPMLSPVMLAMAQVVADIVVARLQMSAVNIESPAEVPARAPTDDWLTAERAATYLGMNKKALYSAVQRGQVPASRLGRRLRFNRAGLDHLLKRRQGRGVQQPSRVPSPGKESERW